MPTSSLPLRTLLGATGGLIQKGETFERAQACYRLAASPLAGSDAKDAGMLVPELVTLIPPPPNPPRPIRPMDVSYGRTGAQARMGTAVLDAATSMDDKHHRSANGAGALTGLRLSVMANGLTTIGGRQAKAAGLVDCRD